MLKAKYIDTLGFRVFADGVDLITVKNTHPKVINTISPNSYGLATRDADFFQSLTRSDYLVLDGVYFAFASILLQGRNIKKNQGPDVFDHFVKRADENGYKVFFFGIESGNSKKNRGQDPPHLSKHQSKKLFSPI